MEFKSPFLARRSYLRKVVLILGLITVPVDIYKAEEGLFMMLGIDPDDPAIAKKLNDALKWLTCCNGNTLDKERVYQIDKRQFREYKDIWKRENRLRSTGREYEDWTRTCELCMVSGGRCNKSFYTLQSSGILVHWYLECISCFPIVYTLGGAINSVGGSSQRNYAYEKHCRLHSHTGTDLHLKPKETTSLRHVIQDQQNENKRCEPYARSPRRFGKEHRHKSLRHVRDEAGQSLFRPRPCYSAREGTGREIR